jgi:AcrR family transcriptional regulator
MAKAVGRKSTVATHPKLAQIHKDLAAEVSIRHIASQYGLSTRALYRYLRDLPADVAKIRTAAEIERGERILTLVVFLQDKLLGILAAAEKSGIDATSISAIRACLDNLQFHAKLTGKVPIEAATVNVQINFLQLPEWIAFKRVLFTALQPFRDARIAVAKAMILEERALEAKANVVR